MIKRRRRRLCLAFFFLSLSLSARERRKRRRLLKNWWTSFCQKFFFFFSVSLGLIFDSSLFSRRLQQMLNLIFLWFLFFFLLLPPRVRKILQQRSKKYLRLGNQVFERQKTDIWRNVILSSFCVFVFITSLWSLPEEGTILSLSLHSISFHYNVACNDWAFPFFFIYEGSIES